MRILAPMITIRQALKDDIGAIVPLWLKLMKMHQELNAYWTPVADAESIVSRDMAEWIEDERMFLFVALDGKDIIGYAIGNFGQMAPVFKLGQKAYIRDTWVEPQYRSKGAGKMLIDEIKKFIEQKGVDLCDVEVAVQNERGAKFWQEQGFVPMTIRLVQQIK